MNSEDYLALLRADLIEEGGAVDGDADNRVLTITRYMGREVEYPTVIRTTREAFHTYLDSMAHSGALLWPDVSPRHAAYRLFLVHLDEEMSVCAGNPDTIDITARKMKPSRSRPYVSPTYPPGDYEWRATPRGPRKG